MTSAQRAAAAQREEQRRLWDGEAARFDDEPDHGLRDPATRQAWRELLAPHLLPAAGEVPLEVPLDVVDVGCGTGTLAVLLAESGHRVRGTDLSPAMVASARAKVAAAGLDGLVRIAEGDAGAPPYDAGSADVVVCRHVLWALPDPDAALAAWVRLLRPGGRLLLVEGRWRTGGGLDAATTRRLVGARLDEVEVEHLSDPVLWGGPITDERYLLRARRPAAG